MQMLPRVTCFAAIAVAAHLLGATTAAAENDDAFVKCIGMAEQIAGGMVPDQSRDNAFSKIVLAYARHGDFAQIASIADQIRDDRSRAMALLDAERWSKVRERDRNAAIALLVAAKAAVVTVGSTHLRDNLYWQIASAQAVNGQAEAARATSDLIESLRDYDLALNRIAAAQAENGDLRGALATAETMRPGRWREDAFAVIAGATARFGDLGAARELSERSHDRRSQALAFVASEKAKTGDREQGLAVAREIADISRKILALRFVAEHAVAAGDMEIARTAYQEAHLAAREAPAHQEHALAEIAAGQAKAELIDDALATIADLEKLPLRQRALINGDGVVWALGKIVQAQARIGRLDDARSTIERARQALPKGEQKNDRALLEIVGMAVAVRDINLARSVASELPDRAAHEGHAPSGAHALQVIAIGLAKSGDFDASVAVVSDIDRVRSRDHVADDTLRQIAVEQTRQDHLDPAFGTVAQIRDRRIQVEALAEMATSAK